MSRSVIAAIERAVLVALLPACDPSISADDAAAADAQDDLAAPIDTGVDAAPLSYLPLPDGCAVTGRPDAQIGVCLYTERLNDPVACGVDVDASQQGAGACAQLCESTETFCTYFGYDAPDGDVTSWLSCGSGTGCVGRLDAMARKSARDRCATAQVVSVGVYLARAAELEAVAARAFEAFARELDVLGAPSELACAARRFADDEREHALIVGALAQRFGHEPPDAPSTIAPSRRDERAFAVENAIEGCVRETWGAAVASIQAGRARDENVRRAMTRIAADEARHAALAFRVDAWHAAHATEDDRRAVTTARAAAIAELSSSLEIAVRDDDDMLGLPCPADARRLFAALRASVWS